MVDGDVILYSSTPFSSITVFPAYVSLIILCVSINSYLFIISHSFFFFTSLFHPSDLSLYDYFPIFINLYLHKNYRSFPQFLKSMNVYFHLAISLSIYIFRSLFPSHRFFFFLCDCFTLVIYLSAFFSVSLNKSLFFLFFFLNPTLYPSLSQSHFVFILYSVFIQHSFCIHSVFILYLFCILYPSSSIPQSHSASITVSRLIYTTTFSFYVSLSSNLSFSRSFLRSFFFTDTHPRPWEWRRVRWAGVWSADTHTNQHRTGARPSATVPTAVSKGKQEVIEWCSHFSSLSLSLVSPPSHSLYFYLICISVTPQTRSSSLVYLKAPVPFDIHIR